MNSDRTRVLLVAACAVAWGVLQVAVPGRFPQIDEPLFKEPGYNLARNGVFAAPAFRGYFNLDPDVSEIFAIYQPLYPALYGAWVSVFPHTFRSAVAYDALIHLALVLTILFGFPVLLGVSRRVAAGTALVCAFMGTLGRPDELAMVWGLLGLCAWSRWNAALRKSRNTPVSAESSGPFHRGRLGGGAQSAIAASLLFALCGATSMPVLLIMVIWASFVWLPDLVAPGSRIRLLRMGSAVAAGTTLLLLAGLGPFYLRAGALAQYRQHAGLFIFSGLLRSIASGAAAPYLGIFVSGVRTNIFMYPMILPVAAAGLWIIARSAEGRWKRAAAGVLAAYGFVILAMPEKVLYFWFLYPVLVALTVTVIPARAAAVLLALSLVAGVNRPLRDLAKTALLPPEQRMAHQTEVLKNAVPATGSFLVDPSGYFIARRHYPGLLVGRQDVRGALRRADYCAWSSWYLRDVEGVDIPGSMLSAAEVLYLKAGFEKIHDGLPKRLPRLFGIPIGVEPRGYGMVLYRRRET
ncbi:hypothetical protein ACFLSJ_07770 [Verrucomicrobiota bacterium]